jgi:hypothetical protein
MDTSRIASTLNEMFYEHSRIVFWYDPEAEFEEALPELGLKGVSLLRLDEHSALAVKVRLEQEDPTGRYLLYAPFEPPEPDKDWLLDMRLYSASFSADRTSTLLAELGLIQQSLRQYLAERAKFFANRDWLERLNKLISPSTSAVPRTSSPGNWKNCAVMTSNSATTPTCASSLTWMTASRSTTASLGIYWLG